MDILLSNLNAPLFDGIKTEDMGAMLHCIGYHISSFSRGEIIALEGEHLKHTKATKVISGHDVTVEFDRPAPLQIDGETFLGVKKYRVLSPAALKKEKEAAFATEKA